MKRITTSCLIALLLTGCADHVSFAAAVALDRVGFLHGVWHGMILPFAWFISLFSESTAIYAIYNNGGWYDFGYLLGAAGVFGGGVAGSK